MVPTVVSFCAHASNLELGQQKRRNFCSKKLLVLHGAHPTEAWTKASLEQPLLAARSLLVV